jgi:hypothetical protein
VGHAKRNVQFEDRDQGGLGSCRLLNAALHVLRRVATASRPIASQNSKTAVLVVIDALDRLIGKPGLGWFRHALAGSALVDPSAVKWSRAGDLFTKEYSG